MLRKVVFKPRLFFLLERARVSGPWGPLGPDHLWKNFWGPPGPLGPHQEKVLFVSGGAQSQAPWFLINQVRELKILKDIQF